MRLTFSFVLALVLLFAGCESTWKPAFNRGDTVVMVGGIRGKVIDRWYGDNAYTVQYADKEGRLQHAYVREYLLEKPQAERVN